MPAPPPFRAPTLPLQASTPLPPPGSDRPRAAAAVFGAGLDLTESVRSGTGAAPPVIREHFDALERYSPELDRDLDDLTFYDLGDLELDGLPMTAALDAIDAALTHAATVAAVGVVLGGEHTASLGAFRGIKRVHPDALLLQLDAHTDLRPEYRGERLNHASWVYRVGEEFGFDAVLQLGTRSGSRAEYPTTRRLGWFSPDLSLPPAVRTRLARHPVYLSVDLDVLDPAFAPGTGAPEPGGVTFRELVAFLYGLAGLRIVGFDLVELSPNLDPSFVTAATAAKLLRELLLLFGSAHAPTGSDAS